MCACKKIIIIKFWIGIFFFFFLFPRVIVELTHLWQVWKKMRIALHESRLVFFFLFFFLFLFLVLSFFFSLSPFFNSISIFNTWIEWKIFSSYTSYFNFNRCHSCFPCVCFSRFVTPPTNTHTHKKKYWFSSSSFFF